MARKSTKPISVTHASNSPEVVNSTSEIATLAYELWQQRGCPEEDWYQAERKIQSQTESQTTFG